jgi:hypothetical protein
MRRTGGEPVLQKDSSEWVTTGVDDDTCFLNIIEISPVFSNPLISHPSSAKRKLSKHFHLNSLDSV